MLLYQRSFAKCSRHRDIDNKDTTESVLNEISRTAKNIIIVGGSSVSYKVEGDMRKKGYRLEE